MLLAWCLVLCCLALQSSLGVQGESCATPGSSILLFCSSGPFLEGWRCRMGQGGESNCFALPRLSIPLAELLPPCISRQPWHGAALFKPKSRAWAWCRGFFPTASSSAALPGLLRVGSACCCCSRAEGGWGQTAGARWAEAVALSVRVPPRLRKRQMYDASVMKYGELAHGESLRGRGWGGAVVPSPPPSRAEPPGGFRLGLQRAVPDATPRVPQMRPGRR